MWKTETEIPDAVTLNYTLQTSVTLCKIQLIHSDN